MTADKAIKIHGSNGSLPLPRRWYGLFPESKLHGGPFRNAPISMHGLCLLEHVGPHALHSLGHHMPIPDFQTPPDNEAVNEALKFVFTQLLRGKPVYVGCAGGWGRTGLMLALIAKATGIKTPIAYVRQHYTRRAVETLEQEDYVYAFDVRPIQKWMRLAALRALPSRLFG